MSNPTPSRRPRRWWKVLGVVLVAIFGFLAALPWMIADGPFRPRVVSGLNRALLPGRIEFEELHLAWFGPTRLDRVTILDPKGHAVIKAGSVVLEKTLAQFFLKDRSPSTLRLDGASIEVTRSEDGTLDIAEALKTLIASPDPARDLTIRVAQGSLRYEDPYLAEPMVADTIDLTIRVPYAPSPVTWSAKLGQGNATLDCQGDFDTWVSRGGPPRKPELQIGLVSQRWPIVARASGVNLTTRLDGSLDFSRKRGRWVFSGEARLDNLDARGSALRGDVIAFEKTEAGWDLAEGEESWKIRRLSLTSPLGQLKAEGQLSGPGGVGKQRIEGTIDLAEIARQLPHALHLRDGLTVDRGKAQVFVDLATDPGHTTYDIEARISDLLAHDQGRQHSLQNPATLTARLVREGDDSQVERLAIHTAFLDASARGRLSEGVDLAGTVDLGGLQKQLGDWVDLKSLDIDGKAELSGRYTLPSSPQTPPSYRNVLKARIKGLRLDGVAPWSIRRDLANLEWTAEGPAQASGLPEGWRQIGLLVQSDQSSVRLDLETQASSTRLLASATTPYRVGNQTRLAALDLSGQWSGVRSSLTFDRLLLSLHRPDREPDESRIQLIARGKFDRTTGDLILEPIPGAEPDALTIDPDGFRISGLAQGLQALRVDGGFSGNLGSLDTLVADINGRTPLGLQGRWLAVTTARGDADGVTLSMKFGLIESPQANPTPKRSNGLALQAHYAPGTDRLDLTEFTVSTPYGTLDASGKLESATGEAMVDLKGVVAPDFAAINTWLVNKVEPGAHLDGKPRSFRATGPIGGSGSKGWKGLDAEVGFDLAEADLYGMKLGPTPVVLRANRGRLLFYPISTTLNEGHIRLEPEVDLDAAGGPILRLAKNSNIREARINDEVSKRVLAFVAPVLDQATRASGLVSVDLDHAEFPIGPGRGRQAKVEGAVVFQNVEFGPGPLAGEILGAIGRRDLSLKLDQPVTLTIADGRVNQRGMSIPIGELTQIELSGWVDFDRNLSLNASVPVTPAMLGNNPLLSDIAAGTRVRLPISGTLDRPTVDKDAFATNMQELGKSLLTRGATRGVMELLSRIARPRDPNAPAPPPRPSAEERKAMRQEKRAIRRGEILPPPTELPRP